MPVTLFNTPTRTLAAAAASLLMSAGLAHAQFGTQSGTQPGAQSSPADSTTTVRVTSSWSMTRTDNGRTIAVKSDNGDVSATIDGKPVPKDRITVDNGHVTITDENGQTIFDQPALDAGVLSTSPNGRMPAVDNGLFPRVNAGRRIRGQASGPGAAVATATQPKSMIGVQLVEPDDSIRGHLGLNQGEAAMVGAVYDGLPAAVAGLEPYDIIVSVDGQTQVSSDRVRDVLKDRDPSKPVSMEVIHRGQKKTVTVTPQAFDRSKLENAKRRSIAAADGFGTGSAWANLNGPGSMMQIQPLGNDPDMAQALRESMRRSFINMNPADNLAGTVPGANGQPRVQVFSTPDDMSAQMDRLMARMAELQAQAGALRNRPDLNGQNLNNAEDRLRRLEQMLQELMQRPTATPPSSTPAAPATQPTSPQSRRTISRPSLYTS